MLIENLKTFIKETCQNAYQTLCGNKQEKTEVFEAELVLHNNNEDVDENIQEETGDTAIEMHGDVSWLPDKEKDSFEQQEEVYAGVIYRPEMYDDCQEYDNL